MSRIRAFGLTLTAVVLSTGVAAAQSVFPSGVNESAPWESHPSAQRDQAASVVGRSNTVFPRSFSSSSNESAPSQGHLSAERPVPAVGATGTLTGSSPSREPSAISGGVTTPFPSSSHETGPVR